MAKRCPAPFARTQYTTYYLHGDGSLRLEPSLVEEASLSYDRHTHAVVAHNTIQLDCQRPSQVVLPITPGG